MDEIQPTEEDFIRGIRNYVQEDLEANRDFGTAYKVGVATFLESAVRVISELRRSPEENVGLVAAIAREVSSKHVLPNGRSATFLGTEKACLLICDAKRRNYRSAIDEAVSLYGTLFTESDKELELSE